ncbi:hypothetical protein F5Y06DRAFT_301745 [Hypoxylon sp. FL0890]|nr:hypothetical protein F5Y06DRAFT_301745 [Hypoxylon sp. FL0890]
MEPIRDQDVGAARKAALSTPTTRQCVICLEEFPLDAVNTLGCGHAHCAKCLKANAHLALRTVPFVPAKCCLVIPNPTLERAGVFTVDEMKQYKHLTEEATNTHSKLYCHDKSCGAFIPTETMKRRVGECPNCGKNTCRTCRQKSHWGPCNQETLQEARLADELVYSLAESKGWKRCPNCLNIVQKAGGCNHVVCKCGQWFCYACGQATNDGGMTHVCPKARARQHQ